MFTKITEFFKENSFLSNLILKGLIVLLIILAGKIINNLINRYVANYFDKKDSQQSKTIKTVVTSTTRWLVYFVVFLSIAQVMGFDLSVIVPVAGFSSVAFGFGAQSLVKDIITGVFILIEEQFQVDDLVTINGVSGRVESIGLRTSTIRNILNNEVYIMPNSTISLVTNKTKDYQKVNLIFKVKYQDDLDAVQKLVSDSLKVFDSDKRLLGTINVTVVADIEEPLLDVTVSVPVQNNMLYAVQSEITDNLMKLFYAHDMEQQYPLTNIHMK